MDQTRVDARSARVCCFDQWQLSALRRSKSERLEARNLRSLCQGRASGIQRHLLGASKEECKDMEKEIARLMEYLLDLPKCEPYS